MEWDNYDYREFLTDKQKQRSILKDLRKIEIKTERKLERLNEKKMKLENEKEISALERYTINYVKQYGANQSDFDIINWIAYYWCVQKGSTITPNGRESFKTWNLSKKSNQELHIMDLIKKYMERM